MRISETTYKYIQDLASRDMIVNYGDGDWENETLPCSSGNYDDTYSWGIQDGETNLAQQLLIMLGQDQN